MHKSTRIRQHTISFHNAAMGVWTAVRTQANIRIHLVATIVVIALGIYFHITPLESIVLILTIAMVIVAEMFNTALEFLSDAVTRENNEFIKRAKDVSAGAVLTTALFAILIGLVIFVR